VISRTASVATITAQFAVVVGSLVQRGKSPRSAEAADRAYQNDENKILGLTNGSALDIPGHRGRRPHPGVEIQKPKPRTTTRPRRDSIFSFLSK